MADPISMREMFGSDSEGSDSEQQQQQQDDQSNSQLQASSSSHQRSTIASSLFSHADSSQQQNFVGATSVSTVSATIEPAPKPSSELYVFRKQLIDIEPRPFSEADFRKEWESLHKQVPAKNDQHAYRIFQDKLHALSEHVIRWRKIRKDDENNENASSAADLDNEDFDLSNIQSNAKFVKWSDGSIQLYIGKQAYDIIREDSLDNSLLFSLGSSVLTSQGKLTKVLSLAPASNSMIAKKKTENATRIFGRDRKTKLTVANVDAEKVVEDVVRGKYRMTQKRNQASAKSGRGTTIDEDFLERGAEDEDQNKIGDDDKDDDDQVTKKKAPTKRKRTATTKKGGKKKGTGKKKGGSKKKKRRTFGDSDDEDDDDIEEDEEIVEDDEDDGLGDEQEYEFDEAETDEDDDVPQDDGGEDDDEAPSAKKKRSK